MRDDAADTICLVGDFSPVLDEGYKNTAHAIAGWLTSRHHEVLRINVKELFSARSWTILTTGRPRILHIITQPTPSSLLLLRSLRARWPRVKTVVSALKPDRYLPAGTTHGWRKVLLSVADPDLVLVQSGRDLELLSPLNRRVAYLPNGVDTERFRPPRSGEKAELRTKYGLMAERPIALHVGHIRAERNLLSLADLPNSGVDVLVAGSLYMGENTQLLGKLDAAGIRVLAGYQPAVEELYRLADCYVFPVRPGNSLSMPLSILEAMATDLPIVTTPFSGVVHAFDTVRGVTMVSDAAGIPAAVTAALTDSRSPETRRAVLPMSWDTVTSELEHHYSLLSALA